MTRTININLLPPEVLEKRKGEKIVVYLLGGMAGLILLLTGIYAFYDFKIREENRQLSLLKAERDRYSQQIGEYQYFETRKKEIENKKAIIEGAMAGEISWSKVLNELSMVVPSDIWLMSFSGSATGISMSGYAVDYAYDVPDEGFKPLARWLIRFSEVERYTNVILGGSFSRDVYNNRPAIPWSMSANFTSAQPAPEPAPPASSTGG